MEKRILVPTDFSKNALNAVRYALDLYAKLNCEFYFLNVFGLDNFDSKSLIVPQPGSEEYETAKTKSEEGFSKLLSILELRHDNPKHSYHTISSFNYLSDAITETISKKHIDLVVMGTQGASGTKGVIFGSNTVNTMEKVTECPVLAVPEDVRFAVPEEIVFPTNYKSDFKREELNYLIEIALMHEASIRVLYVSKKTDLKESQEKNKQLLDNLLAMADHSFHTIAQKEVSEGITSFVESRSSDMIAFINRKHFFFSNIFSKPLIKEVGYDATVPILALI